MNRAHWTFERSFGVHLTRDGVTFFHNVRGTPRPITIARGSSRRSVPTVLWALPLLATAGIAVALPTSRSHQAAALDITLDTPVERASAPKTPSAPRLAVARPRPVVSQPKLPRDSVLTPAADNALTTAIAAAMRTGEPTDWRDDTTGDSGIVVVGTADPKGCRDVVVMTRRADGGIDNAPRQECLS
ncbi:MAG: hypothetical protein ACKVOP_10050 [Sphingomonadaceae bacterium]